MQAQAVLEEVEVDDEAKINRESFGHQRRFCPVCLLRLRTTKYGKYPKHGDCPAGGKFVYHNGVVM
jgi:hypothetical protein